MPRYTMLLVLLVCGLLQWQSGVGQEAQTAEADDGFEYIHGRLSYRRKADSSERGYEDWWLTRNRDGSRTMRTLAMTGDSKFVRDVTYTVDANERPLQVFIQLQVGDRLTGTGYFRVSGDTMKVMTDSVDTGHTLQTIEVPNKFHVLTHAVMLDGWPAWALEQVPGRDQTIAVYTTSPHWNGTTGPLGQMIEQRFTYLGTERITVPAGTFDTRHYSFGDGGSQVWVTGEHNILVRYDWEPRGLEYVLTELTFEPRLE